MAEIGLPQAIGRVLGVGWQRIHCERGHEEGSGAGPRAGLTTQAGQCRMIVANWLGMSNPALGVVEAPRVGSTALQQGQVICVAMLGETSQQLF